MRVLAFLLTCFIYLGFSPLSAFANLRLPLLDGEREPLDFDPEKGQLKLGDDLWLRAPVLVELDETGRGVAAHMSNGQGSAPLLATLMGLPAGQAFILVQDCQSAHGLSPDTPPRASGTQCLFVGRAGQPPVRLDALPDGGAAALRPLIPPPAPLNMAAQARLIQTLDQMGAIPILAPASMGADFPGMHITSASYGQGRSKVRILTHASPDSGRDVLLNPGLTLLAFGPDGAVSVLAEARACDPDFLPTQGPGWVEIIAAASAAAPVATYGLIAHDSAFCGDGPQVLAPLLAGLGLTQFSSLTFRAPYIALIQQGQVVFEGMRGPGARLETLTPGIYGQSNWAIPASNPPAPDADPAPISPTKAPQAKSRCVAADAEPRPTAPFTLRPSGESALNAQTADGAPGEGFWDLEDSGIWFGAQSGTLTLEWAANRPAPATLTLTGTTFADLPIDLRFADQVFQPQGAFRIQITIAPTWVQQGMLTIPLSVQADRFACPAEELGGVDTRTLAFFLTSLSIEAP